jgi:hypothetical protein
MYFAIIWNFRPKPFKISVPHMVRQFCISNISMHIVNTSTYEVFCFFFCIRNFLGIGVPLHLCHSQPTCNTYHFCLSRSSLSVVHFDATTMSLQARLSRRIKNSRGRNAKKVLMLSPEKDQCISCGRFVVAGPMGLSRHLSTHPQCSLDYSKEPSIHGIQKNLPFMVA